MRPGPTEWVLQHLNILPKGDKKYSWDQRKREWKGLGDKKKSKGKFQEVMERRIKKLFFMKMNFFNTIFFQFLASFWSRKEEELFNKAQPWLQLTKKIKRGSEPYRGGPSQSEEEVLAGGAWGCWKSSVKKGQGEMAKGETSGIQSSWMGELQSQKCLWGAIASCTTARKWEDVEAQHCDLQSRLWGKTLGLSKRVEAGYVLVWFGFFFHSGINLLILTMINEKRKSKRGKCIVLNRTFKRYVFWVGKCEWGNRNVRIINAFIGKWHFKMKHFLWIWCKGPY